MVGDGNVSVFKEVLLVASLKKTMRIFGLKYMKPLHMMKKSTCLTRTNVLYNTVDVAVDAVAMDAGLDLLAEIINSFSNQ